MAQNCPVDVISVCSKDGTIKPLRLQMQDEQNQLMRVNIDEVVSCREVTHVGAESSIFLCRATVLGQQWVFELKYALRTHSWSVVRKLF